MWDGELEELVGDRDGDWSEDRLHPTTSPTTITQRLSPRNIITSPIITITHQDITIFGNSSDVK
jgi:hypothetical protein